MFPTKMNEALKPYIGKDFDMDVVEEGETLRVILTRTKDSNARRKIGSGDSCKLINLKTRSREYTRE